MRKRIIIFAAALCVALVACEQQSARESAPPAMAVPTAVQTTQPTAAPTPVATAEPVLAPTEVPVDTPAPTSRPTPVPTAVPSAQVSVMPTPEPMPTQAPSPTPEPAIEPPLTETPSRPDDMVVLQAYHEAEEAYRWFDQTTLPLAAPDVQTGFAYYPVADERFPTMDALRTYLKSLFSDEVVDRLLPIDGEHYVEIDGVLCAIDMMRGTNENSGTVTETVVWPEEAGGNLCTVHVEVELIWEDENYPEGKRIYDFPYQKVGDKWVFTHLEPIM